MSTLATTTPSPAATTPSARPVVEHLNSAASPPRLTATDVPSVFETLAADDLRELIQPAFRYVLAFFAQRYPRYLLRLVNRHEEVYAAVLCLVEGYHLHVHNSTFTDHFYGLEFRSAAAPDPTAHQTPSKPVPLPPSRLSRRQKLLALAYIVGIPYVRSKLQDLYERLGGGVDVDLVDADDRENIYRITPRRRLSAILATIFKRLYPYVNLAYEVGTVGYDIAFAFGRTRWWRWWMRVVGVEVVRAGAGDGSLVGRLEGWLSTSSSPTTRALTTILRLGSSVNPLATILLALKFLQWWYSPSSPRLMAEKDAEVRTRVDVRPPRMVVPAMKGYSALNREREGETAADDIDSDSDSNSDDSDSETNHLTPSPPPTTPGTPADPTLPYRQQGYGLCPICNAAWANPTITPTGYMGCFVCLYAVVERLGVCPVTGVRMGTDELRKVLV